MKLSKPDADLLKLCRTDLDAATRFIPIWVKIAVAITLGLGTMVGWKKSVITVGEKIGKTHLNYAQGASAELAVALAVSATACGRTEPAADTSRPTAALQGKVTLSCSENLPRDVISPRDRG